MIMFRLVLFFTLLLGTFSSALAQQTLEQTPQTSATPNVPISDTLTGTFYNDEIGLRIHVDLGKERLIVPGMSFLGMAKPYFVLPMRLEPIRKMLNSLRLLMEIIFIARWVATMSRRS